MRHILFIIPIFVVTFATYMSLNFPGIVWVSLLIVSLIGTFIQLKNHEKIKWENLFNASKFLSAILSAFILIYGS